MVFVVLHTIVWEKFSVKNFSSLVGHDENQMQKLPLTMNRKINLIFSIWYYVDQIEMAWLQYVLFRMH